MSEQMLELESPTADSVTLQLLLPSHSDLALLVTSMAAQVLRVNSAMQRESAARP